MSTFSCLDRLLLYHYIQITPDCEKVKIYLVFFVIFFIM